MVKIILKVDWTHRRCFVDSSKNVSILMTKGNLKEMQRNYLSWSHWVKEMADVTFV